MDRRNFLRTGGMAVLGSLAMPSLAMPGSVRGALGGADSKSAGSGFKESNGCCFGKGRRLCGPLLRTHFQ